MHFDIVIGGDWRLQGGITIAADHEIRALSESGLRVGIVQLNTHLSGTRRPLDKKLSEHVSHGRCVLIEPGSDRIQTRLLCLHHPAVLVGNRQKLARFDADQVLIIVHRPPLDGTGTPVYPASEIQRIAADLFQGKVKWAPVSPVCRENLIRADPHLELLRQDWVNFIYPNEWTSARRKPLADVPIIGRHSRPAWDKWPDNRKQLFEAYPKSADVLVRVLGGGEALDQLAGKIPKNWTVLEWDDVPVPEFLRTIDFFVYFHHSSWVEAFGRTIIEAMASGCVVILPEYLRATFSGNAIYSKPSDVMQIVQSLHGNWPEYRKLSAAARKTVERQFGPAKYMSTLRTLLGPGRAGNQSVSTQSAPVIAAPTPGVAAVRHPSSTATPDGHSKPEVAKLHTAEFAVATPVFRSFDLIYCLDYNQAPDTMERIGQEIRIASDAGYAVAIINLPASGQTPAPMPVPLLNVVETGGASDLTDTREWLACSLLITSLPDLPARIMSLVALRVHAERVLVIPDASYAKDPVADHQQLCLFFGDVVSWSATNAPRRAKFDKTVPVERLLWSPSVPQGKFAPRKRGKMLVLGSLCQPEHSLWPLLPGKDQQPAGKIEIQVHALEGASDTSAPAKDWPSAWRVFDNRKISLEKFIAALDVAAFYPKEPPKDIPYTAIALALTSGIPVLLPPELRQFCGNGPVYAAAAEAATSLRSLVHNAERARETSVQTAETGAMLFGPQHFVRRLGQLTRPPAFPAPAISKAGLSRRILMLSSNGTGIGHVTRQLAIARRLPPEFSPIFATMGHAAGIIAAFGYLAEYVPSQIYTDTKARDWDKWVEREILSLIDYYDASLVVFDGNAPPDGLLRAVGPRCDRKLAWVRRGMWKQSNSRLLEAHKYFDLVVEPEDIAGDVDIGATAKLRDETLSVPPIRLLDKSDLLTRQNARTALGLDQGNPAVLIQIGSGSNRDIVGLIGEIIAQLRGVPNLQIFISEWAISSDSLAFWPGTRILRGFPTSQYFNAFDFTISAAGYNSFNEIISFELPAIFLANDHPSMDDQLGRAKYAERQGAAVTLDPNAIGELEKILPLFLVESSREFLRANCRRIARDNGAGMAASSLVSLIR